LQQKLSEERETGQSLSNIDKKKMRREQRKKG